MRNAYTDNGSNLTCLPHLMDTKLSRIDKNRLKIIPIQ